MMPQTTGYNQDMINAVYQMLAQGRDSEAFVLYQAFANMCQDGHPILQANTFVKSLIIKNRVSTLN